MNDGRRYGYLDLIKIIAMMCVCLYHYPLIRQTTYVRPFTADVLALRYFRVFDAICVPLFMMVNGALILNRPFQLKKHITRCVTLLAGVYVWYIVTMVLGHAWKNGFAFVIENWSGILHSAQYLYEYGGISTSHLWFIHMLVAVYLLVPMLRAVIDSRDVQIQKGAVFFLGAMGVFAFLLQDISHVRAAVPVLRSLDLSGLDMVNPFRGMYGAMVVYFVLGGLLHRAHEKILRVPMWFCAAMLLGGSLVLFAQWYLVTIRQESMYDIVFGGYNCLPTLLMATGVFIGMAKLEDRLHLGSGRLGGVISLIGRNTLAIYYLHWIMGLTVLSLVEVQGSFVVNLIKAAAMVLSCALLGEGIRRIPLLRRLV